MSFLKDLWETTKDSLKVITKFGLNPFDDENREELLEAPKKHFKQVTSTDAGKAVVAALAIWFGGGALGAWKTGAGWVDGALVGGAEAAGAAEGAAAAGEAASSGATLAESAGALAETGGAAAPAAAESAIGATQGGALGLNEAGSLVSASNFSTPASLGIAEGAGTGGGFLKTAGTFVKNNPELTGAVLQGVNTALTPDPLEQQREYYEEDRKRREANLRVGDVSLGVGGEPGPLRDQYGNRVYSDRGSLLGSRLRGLRNNRS